MGKKRLKKWLKMSERISKIVIKKMANNGWKSGQKKEGQRSSRKIGGKNSQKIV